MHTNMQSFGKTAQLKNEHFKDFIKAYTAKDRSVIKDERWSVFTREQIKEKNDSLDLGLIRDDSVLDYEDLQDPVESGEEIIAQLEEATDLIMIIGQMGLAKTVISKTKGVVGQANISITQSRNLLLPIPKLEEQKEIVGILDSLLENEQKAKELCDVIDKIDLMKKSILARAFRGELSTNNPDEERGFEGEG